MTMAGMSPEISPDGLARGQAAQGTESHDGARNTTATLHKRLTAWLENKFRYERPRRGEVREAVILEISENDILVDIGAKRDGVVPRNDLDLLDDAYCEELRVGDRVPVVILRPRGRRDGTIVSINKGLQQRDWLRAADLMATERILDAEVVDWNRGGVLVSFGRLRGFVPNSHLTAIPRGVRGQELREAKSSLLGQNLRLAVIEVNQRRRRLVLSERKANRQRREQALRELTEGDVRTGTVVNLVDFGAFVDLGGVDGLIHISELDWTHVNHPGDVLSLGDRVEVYVLSVDRERERVGLSRKRLLPDPWHAVTEGLDVGQVVKGDVTNVVDFGAFVDLGQGIEGLVHVSEMPTGKATPTELQPGSPIAVRVLEIEHDRRRIALSLRGATDAVSQAFHEQWVEPEREQVDVLS
jgi:small subunit ribosomal protein S1